MNLIAKNEDQVLLLKTWYNDDIGQRSSIINAADVAEICGETQLWVEKFNSLEELNEECYGFSFSEEAKY